MTDPDRRPVERETVVVTDSGGGGGASGAIIAVVLLLIVLVVGYVLYRNGVFGGGSVNIPDKIDVHVGGSSGGSGK